MKHKLSITLTLLAMFLITQFIGIYVAAVYGGSGDTLPFGLETPNEDVAQNFFSIIISFIIAFSIVYVMIKYKWKVVMKIWFFLVTALALGISLVAFLGIERLYSPLIAVVIAIPLAYFKMFKPNVWNHNTTELLIYPGIAAVFIPILSPFSVIWLLLIISFYDMWAVWKSGIMQKMAKYQMDELKIFGGFLIPSVSAKVRKELKNIKQKYKGKKIPKKIATKKYKVSLAILGGGDVVFPIITAGVFMTTFNSIVPALFIIFGALAGLIYLFARTKKGKAYPAMPYISSGIFIGIILWRLIFYY
ncbi:MAG: hypothetical protein HOG34_05840 [Bacteroidetes bacterium]|nr:hypothetical protein [Bacteroidota bacterium]